jgi:hypothetical protein
VEDEDSCGKSEPGETPQERSDEEAHRPPAESEVFHGNQKRYSRIFFNEFLPVTPTKKSLTIKIIQNSLIDFPKQTI